MSKRDRKVPSLKKIRNIQILMIVGYAVIVIAALVIVSSLTIAKTDEVLKDQAVNLTSSLNVQMKLNMDSYLSRMETIATLAFGEESSYTYDATDPSNDEFEAINTEKVITDKLYSLCIMENFVDYGIVYRNNRTVGKISNGTSTLFGDKLFTELSSMITRPRTNDGWSTGYQNDFKRIYYVKQVHENAVLFISFYASELDSVFDNPESLKDMKIRLVNSEYDTIYSEDSSEIGEPLPEEIISRIKGRSSTAEMDNDYLVSVNSCGDWFVVCSIPSSSLLSEKNEMTTFIYITAIAAAFLAVLGGFIFSYQLIRPIRKTVTTLDTKASVDLLTGVFNKLSFEEYAGNALSNSLESEMHAMIILDLDNFKGINDTLGHAFGDSVLKRTGEILRTTFSEDDYLGRIGGDEFCVLVNTRFDDSEKFRAFVRDKCEELCRSFHDSFADKSRELKISASIGAAFSPESGTSFTELYAAVDKALYRSKKSGRDTYSFYEPDKESEGAK